MITFERGQELKMLDVDIFREKAMITFSVTV